MFRDALSGFSSGRYLRLATNIFACVAVLIVLADLASAQAPPKRTSVDDQPTRGIQVQLELTLGDADGPGMLCYLARGSFIASVARDAQGNTYVSSDCDCKVQVFGPDTRFKASFGRCGEGPGENSQIDRIAVGEWIYIADSSRRIHVYSQALQLQRQFRVSGQIAAITSLANGNLAVNQEELPPGSGLYEYTPDGKTVTSFRTSSLREGGDRLSPYQIGRLSLVGDDEGMLWGARRAGRYQIAKWRVGVEEPVTILTRNASWYDSGENPLRMLIAGLSWSDGMVWTLHQRPELDHSTVVEAIDPARGELIGQSVFDKRFGFLGLADAMLWRMTDKDGNLVLELYRTGLN